MDLDKKILAVDSGMHVDLEQFLLEQGSKQAELWGINLYKDLSGEDWIEFDSMINLRPSQNNRSRGVDSPERREQIRMIVDYLIK